MLAAQYFCWSIGVYGFVIWLPSMLQAGRSLGIVEIGWLSAAPILLAALLMVGPRWHRTGPAQRKHFVWPFLLVGAVAFYGSYLLGTSNSGSASCCW